MWAGTSQVARLLVVVVSGALLLGACRGSDAPDASGDGPSADSAGGHATGTLRLGLEPTDTVFIEGFQLQLGVDTAEDGEQRTHSWEQLVMDRALEWPEGVSEQDIGWWYQGVLVAELPAGPVTITSKLDVGMEPEGSPCAREFELPEDGTLEVVVRLTEPDRGCPVGAATDG